MKNKELIINLEKDFIELADHYDQVCKDLREGNIEIEDIKPTFITDEVIIISMMIDNFYKIPQELISFDLMAHGLNLTNSEFLKDQLKIKKIILDDKLQEKLILMLNYMQNKTDEDDEEFAKKFYKGYVRDIYCKWNDGDSIEHSYYIGFWPLAMAENLEASSSLLLSLETYIKSRNFKMISFSNVIMDDNFIMKKIRNHPNYSMAKVILENMETTSLEP